MLPGDATAASGGDLLGGEGCPPRSASRSWTAGLPPRRSERAAARGRLSDGHVVVARSIECHCCCSSSQRQEQRAGAPRSGTWPMP